MPTIGKTLQSQRKPDNEYDNILLWLSLEMILSIIEPLSGDYTPEDIALDNYKLPVKDGYLV